MEAFKKQKSTKMACSKKPFKAIRPLAVMLFIAALAMASCKKDPDLTMVQFGYEYFPIELGSYKIYLVDSIGHDLTSDTAQFQIMEVVEEQFTDNVGNPAYRIGRYKRITSSDDWSFQYTIVEKRTTTFAERKEGNLSYIKMVFPINDEQTWDGNAYNFMDPWNYAYSGIGLSANLGLFNFDRSLTVNQRNSVNLVDQEIASEIYAAGIGLIHKQLIDLNIQNEELTGIEWEQTILAYGTQL